MSKKMWIGGAAVGLLAIGAIGASLEDDEKAPEVAVVSAETGVEVGTQEPTPTEEPTEEPVPAPEPEPVPEPMEEVIENRVSNAEREAEDDDLGMSDSEIAHLALQITWEGMTISEQSDICFGWDIDQEMMVDAFLEGSGDMMTRSEVRAFFDGVC